MKIFEVDGQGYQVRRKFHMSRVKDLEGLGKLKWYYSADTLILDKTNNLVILANKISDAIIIEETENGKISIDESI